MSLIQYCMSCSSPNHYTLTKPRFCINCGQAFAQSAANYKPIPTPQKTQSTYQPPRKQYNNPDDEGNDLQYCPQIDESKLAAAFQIDIEPPRRISMEDAMRNPTPPKPIERQVRAGKFNKKQFIEQYKAQSSNTRNVTEINPDK